VLGIRSIKKVWKSSPTIEGAGVHLKRAFGNTEVPLLDPFLLLDDFHSNQPKDYIAGFPWHPHRGIETITYMLHGKMKHGDSLGNGGVIQAGDIQWMTAGSGIIHQEMPKKQEDDSLLWGFQLWANLPKSHKMMDPRYRGITSEEIPEVSPIDHVRIKIICGEIDGVKGPVQDIVTDPEYLDVTVEAGTEFSYNTKNGQTVIAYVIEGSGYLDQYKECLTGVESLILFDDGSEIMISTNEAPIRFLLISGRPLKEPVAWYGPIVMNTWEELQVAFEEYRKGTFIKI